MSVYMEEKALTLDIITSKHEILISLKLCVRKEILKACDYSLRLMLKSFFFSFYFSPTILCIARLYIYIYTFSTCHVMIGL
jgi:hypothetical protein